MQNEWRILLADRSESIRDLLRFSVQELAKNHAIQQVHIVEKECLLEAKDLLFDRTFLQLIICECIYPLVPQEEVDFLKELCRSASFLPSLLLYTSQRPTTNKQLAHLIDMLTARPNYRFRYLERPSDMEELEVAILTLLGFAPV